MSMWTKELVYTVLLLWLNVARPDDVIVDEYIVTLSEGYTHKLLDSLVTIKTRYPTIGERLFYLIETSQENLAHLQKLDIIDYFEENKRVKLIHPVDSESPVKGHDPTVQIVSEPLAGCQHQYQPQTGDIWGLIRTSHESNPNFNTAPFTWEHDGSGVDVYVMDSGVDVTHPDFAGRAEHGMVSSDLAHEGTADLNGHGTHVASIAGGAVWGAAKSSRLINVKILDWEGFGTLGGILEGVTWCLQQVRAQRKQGKNPKAIINLSLGFEEHSRAIYDVIKAGYEEGIVYVAAAGNERTEAVLTFPSGYYPTISVGSSDRSDQLSTFSNRGCGVEIIAPGSSITAAHSRELDRCTMDPNCIITMSGTSMAAPLVAGLIARYMSSFSQPPAPEQVRHWLTATAHPLVRHSRRDMVTLLAYKSCGNTNFDPERVSRVCYFDPHTREVVHPNGTMYDQDPLDHSRMELWLIILLGSMLAVGVVGLIAVGFMFIQMRR